MKKITEKLETFGLPEREALQEAPGAWWNVGNVGLLGTRKDTLEAIMRWSSDSESERLYWLTGVAGCGKSTIAHTVAQSLRDRLGACFFFNRIKNDLNHSEFLMTTLARQLARYSDDLAREIRSVTEANGSIGSLPLVNQMHQLIVQPMQAVRFPEPVVIILDALDENGNAETRRALLDALAAEIPQLPSYVKMLITSRDEPGIRAALDIGLSSRADVRSETRADVRTYLEYRFSMFSKKHPHLPNDWPGKNRFDDLVHRADGLFIWAKIACNFIDDGYDPDLGLEKLMSEESADRGEAEGKLNRLYLTVLEDALASQTGDDRNHYQHVVGAVIALKDPLTIESLDAILGLQRQNFQAPLCLTDGNRIRLTSSVGFISRLGPILRSDAPIREGRVRVLHSSVIDFLRDKNRSGEFYIDVSGRNRMLAGRCMTRMRASLTRDICRLNGPLKFNRDVEDVEERIRSNISGDVRYACEFWAQHLHGAPRDDPELLCEVRNFMFQHLLHWLEAMSLLNLIDKVVPMVELVEEWSQACIK
jgi:hypothetical protein